MESELVTPKSATKQSKQTTIFQSTETTNSNWAEQSQNWAGHILFKFIALSKHTKGTSVANYDYSEKLESMFINFKVSLSWLWSKYNFVSTNWFFKFFLFNYNSTY